MITLFVITAALVVSGGLASDFGKGDAEKALYVRLNSGCDGQLESDGCVSHPRSARIKSLECLPIAAGVTTCKYQRQIRTISSSTPKWQPAETTFEFSETRERWQVKTDTDI